jgi:hypothetical protein
MTDWNSTQSLDIVHLSLVLYDSPVSEQIIEEEELSWPSFFATNFDEDTLLGI